MTWRGAASVGLVSVAATAAGLAPTPGGGRRGSGPAVLSPGRVETLRSIGGLPVEVVGEFREPLGYQRTPSGRQFVFDRRGHTVYGFDAAGATSRKLVAIGGEAGRVI